MKLDIGRRVKYIGGTHFRILNEIGIIANIFQPFDLYYYVVYYPTLNLTEDICELYLTPLVYNKPQYLNNNL